MGEKMKTDTVVVGVILIIVGAIAFFMGQSMIDNIWQSYPHMQETMDTGNFLKGIGGLLLIAGTVISIIGATSPDKNGKRLQQLKNRGLEKQIFCSDCGTEVKSDVKFCPKCGEKFEEKKEKQINCSKCGNEVESDDIFCSKCGEKFVKKK